MNEERALLPRASQKEEQEMAYVPQDLPLRDWNELHLREL